MLSTSYCRGLPSSRGADSALAPPPPPFLRGLPPPTLSAPSQRTCGFGSGHSGSSPSGFLHETKARGATLSCRYSSLAVTGALATYDIPPQQSSEQRRQQRRQQRDGEGPMPRWLSQGISEAVAHLDQAPFLQLLVPGSADSYLRHRVTTAVVQSPPLWHGIAQHLAKAAPDILILIHPMHRTPDRSSHSALEAARQTGRERGAGVLTGIAIGDDRRRTEHDARLAATARAFSSGLAAPALSGRVGDCCDEDAELPFTNALASRREAHSHAHGPVREGDFQTEFWGVVVQTKAASSADGCYILKTMRSGAGGGCTCTHYSMVSVCKGEPYSAQLSACWLI